MFKSFPYKTISCLNTNFLFGGSLCTVKARRFWVPDLGLHIWGSQVPPCEPPQRVLDNSKPANVALAKLAKVTMTCVVTKEATAAATEMDRTRRD